jgi:malonyl-CoA O-methyltransferase
VPPFVRLFTRRRKPATLAPRAAYELWAPGYPPVAHNPLMRAEQRAVEDVLRELWELRPARALDIGTGSGRYLPILAAAGASHVTGLDFSQAMLARARPGFSRIRGDARRLPFRRESFDLINASLMAGDVDDLVSLFDEVSAVLAPGGHFIYSDFHPAWTAKGWQRTFRTASGQHIALAYTPRRLDDHVDALRRAGLRVVSVREPRLNPEEHGPEVEAFRRQWDNPQVVIVLHATKEPSAGERAACASR